MSVLAPISQSTIIAILQTLKLIAGTGLPMIVLRRLFQDVLETIYNEILDIAVEHSQKHQRTFVQDDIGTYTDNYYLSFEPFQYKYLRISIPEPPIWIGRKFSYQAEGKDEFIFGNLSLWTYDFCIDLKVLRFQYELLDISRYPLPITAIHFWSASRGIESIIEGVAELQLSLSLI